jgi:HEAT repeats
MFFRSPLGTIAALVLVTSVAAPSAQTVAQSLRDASEARAGGQLDKALSIVDAVVARSPANASAARLKIEILLAESDFGRALDAYDASVAARKQPDPLLLGVLATSALQELGQRPDPAISVPALERLARFGDTSARQALIARETADRPPSIESLPVLTSLVRLGHPDAEASLGGLLISAPPNQLLVVLQAVREARARTLAPAVAGMLSDADPLVRIAAAQTLGVLQVPSTVPQLQAAFTADPVPTVRMFVGIALKRLGQSSADAMIAGLLASQVAEIRLLAGEAYQGSKTRQWVPRIQELGTDPNEQHRVRAAELLACCDPTTATSLLRKAAASPNPLLRREAARVLESTSIGDAALLRRLLGDSDEMVRLLGAGSALEAAQPAAPAH